MNKNQLIILLLIIFIALLRVPIVSQLKQKRAADLALAQLQAQQVAAQKAADAAAEAKKLADEKTYLLGKFDPATEPGFVPVPAIYNVSGYQPYLRKETMDAFTQMAEAAEKDDIELNIASATRNFDYQKNLWDSKWTGALLEDGQNLAKTIPDGLARFNKILEYSAVPGTSRHHWGTEVDINGADVGYFETEEGKEVYNWLTQNAATYGFCQTYTAKGPDRRTGYNEEKWHWSYLPLSRNFTNEYAKLITENDISGFDGDQYVAGHDLINSYVLSINPACR